MGLPWVRWDSNIASHPKVLQALGKRGGKAAMAVYAFSLGYAGGHGTDGHICRGALPVIHGTPADAAILVEVGLWDIDAGQDGWWIHNYAQRQETSSVTDAKREAQRQGAAQTNCKRYHPAGCQCWKRPPLASVQ